MTIEDIQHPEYKKLMESLEKLKDKMIILLGDKAELVNHRNKQIKIEYITKIGKLEYKLFQIQYKISRIRRKIEMVQSAINLEVDIDIEFIDKELDKEYEESILKLEEMTKETDISNKVKQNETISCDQGKLLKELYKNLAKILHPDLNSNLSSEQKDTWFKVVDAYESSNVHMLKNIFEKTNEKMSRDLSKQESILQIKNKIKFFESEIYEIMKDIDKIKKGFPYNQVELLNNDIKVKDKQKEILSYIETDKKLLNELENYFQMITSRKADYLS